MIIFLSVLISFIAVIFFYAVIRDKTIRNFKRFFVRVAELVSVPDDSPPSYVLETLRKTITNLEDEVAMAQKSRENTMTLLDNIVDPIFFVDSSTG
ncbi:MAG TPA: PAS domain-containing sensor histidine kinase, partial [Pseudothermotoga sp.]